MKRSFAAVICCVIFLAAAGGALAEELDVEELTASAEAGDAASQYKLGAAYEIGTCVEQNAAEAAMWYRKAAEQGHAEAQNSLADLYEDGEGVEQSHTLAIQWRLVAAENGHVRAQFFIGLAHIAGDVVEEDIEIACRWISLAAIGEPDDENIRHSLDMAKKGLSAAQIKDAEKWARAKFKAIMQKREQNGGAAPAKGR